MPLRIQLQGGSSPSHSIQYSITGMYRGKCFSANRLAKRPTLVRTSGSESAASASSGKRRRTSPVNHA